MSSFKSLSPRFSRRALVGSSLAGAALLPLGSLQRAAAEPALAHRSRSALQAVSATSPAGWRTWHLKTSDELRPAKPADPTKDEIDEIIGFQAKPTEEQTSAIKLWGTGPAVLAWSAMAPDLNVEFKGSGPRLSRIVALLHTAMSDAVLAAWDAQLTYGRVSPAAADSHIIAPGGVDPAQSSFPSAHAAVAGAAAEPAVGAPAPEVDGAAGCGATPHAPSKLALAANARDLNTCLRFNTTGPPVPPRRIRPNAPRGRGERDHPPDSQRAARRVLPRDGRTRAHADDPAVQRALRAPLW